MIYIEKLVAKGFDLEKGTSIIKSRRLKLLDTTRRYSEP